MHADHAGLVRLQQSCLEVAYCIFILIFRTEAGSLLWPDILARRASPLMARTRQTLPESLGARPLAGSLSPTSTAMPHQVVFGGPPLRRSPPLAGRQDRSSLLTTSAEPGHDRAPAVRPPAPRRSAFLLLASAAQSEVGGLVAEGGVRGGVRCGSCGDSPMRRLTASAHGAIC